MPYANKEQRRIYDHKWRLEHKEDILAYQKDYRLKNKETISAKQKDYRLKNKETISARKKEYHAATYKPVGDQRYLQHPDGSFQRVRSMSEAYWFAMLDEIGLDYISEVKLETELGVYWADCYIPSLDLFVEVKAEHWVRDDQMARIELLREQGLSIVIVDSDWVDKEFGV